MEGGTCRKKEGKEVRPFRRLLLQHFVRGCTLPPSFAVTHTVHRLEGCPRATNSKRTAVFVPRTLCTRPAPILLLEEEQEKEQDGQEGQPQAVPEEEDGEEVFSFKYSPGKLRGNQYKKMMTKEELEEEQRIELTSDLTSL
ncbi:matrix-remodeling-associated protein 7 isoform X2 [Leptonychotes weddellii]|uniref:Matrix-remodeling-associated protein 7 isoform X2 n=1 Tax=Leptonychotes weddellii TaxID=9713 RepID=A0A7F8RHU5_LEPWE|nr:matrix-remodeling-associated protein 7 isoform X2 [Leptonychotes weddellii]